MISDPAVGAVVAVSSSPDHRFTKPVQEHIHLLAGLGVRGDAHLGVTVQHRSRVAQDPTKPNLRQVHLVHDELLDELRDSGFQVFPGAIGENITTRGLDLLALPLGARLRIGSSAVVGVTGLRNPCRQLNTYQQGLMAAVLDRDPQGNLVLKAGIMGIVLAEGDVKAGDRIWVDLPPEPHQTLLPV